MNTLISTSFDDNRKLICFLKAYESDKTIFRGLHVPSESLLDFVTKMENVFIANFSMF